MAGWWQTLSRRERLLIALMGGVVGLFLIVFVVIRPLSAYRADGRMALDSAQTTALLVERAAANAGDRNTGEAVSGADLRGVITAYAARHDIPVSAFQLSQTGNSVIISVESVSAPRLFDWLARLEQERSVSVTEARISAARAGDETVQARLTLSAGA